MVEFTLEEFMELYNQLPDSKEWLELSGRKTCNVRRLDEASERELAFTIDTDNMKWKLKTAIIIK